MAPSQFESDMRSWTNQDFDNMGWHDATVHAIAFQPINFSMLFDIDYILQWVEPKLPEVYFSFWVAPATLVFENVSEVQIDIKSEQGHFTLQSIERSDQQLTPNGKMFSWLWLLDGNEGTISFRATGFTQHFRKLPILTVAQALNYNKRDSLL